MSDAASDNISSAATRDARGRFQPGCSGNPAGKRPGTLNRATLLKRAMADGDAERIASLIVERALKGEWGALRFVQDRLEPKPRARPIMLDFPEGATVAEMSEIVLRATATGEISPEEALQIMRLLNQVDALQSLGGRHGARRARPGRASDRRAPPARSAGGGAGPAFPQHRHAAGYVIDAASPRSDGPDRRAAGAGCRRGRGHGRPASSPQFAALMRA